MLQNNTTTEQDKPKPDPLALAYEIREIAPWRQNLSRRALRSYFGFWQFVGAHWLFILNLVNGICLIAAFGVPVMALAGWDGPANVVFGLFHYVCVQNPHHSFFIGDKQMCLCQRCTAIYGGLLLTGLVFYFVRRTKVEPLKMWQFVVFFCVPIGVDSLTQLFGWRESNWELRFLTGGLFAVGAVWTLYPLVEARMNGLRRWASREQATEPSLLLQ